MLNKETRDSLFFVSDPPRPLYFDKLGFQKIVFYSGFAEMKVGQRESLDNTEYNPLTDKLEMV